MIRVMIVDDEPLARDSARLVLESDPDVQVVASCSGVGAARAAAETRPDLIFLDVEMPEVDGFEVVAAIGPDAAPAIVFVTAYDHYAVRAFEIHALDYVLKPFDDQRLLAALARARRHLGTRRAAGPLTELLAERERARPHVLRFVVRERDRTVIIAAADVDWLEEAHDYDEIHAGGAVHMIRERLSQLEMRLDPARFVRVHRSTIVNLERVREVVPLIRGDATLVLAGGATVRLSRSRRAEFIRRLSGSPTHGDGSPHRR